MGMHRISFSRLTSCFHLERLAEVINNFFPVLIMFSLDINNSPSLCLALIVAAIASHVVVVLFENLIFRRYFFFFTLKTSRLSRFCHLFQYSSTRLRRRRSAHEWVWRFLYVNSVSSLWRLQLTENIIFYDGISFNAEQNERQRQDCIGSRDTFDL